MNLKAWLTSHGEAAQYVAFFGVLFVMLLWERTSAMGPPRVPRAARWRVNFALTAINVLVLGALPTSFMVAADYAASAHVGLMNRVSLPLWAVPPIGLLVRGFISWITHLQMHKVPLFWRVHRVHHTDVELDASTTVRFHPLEFPITLAIGLPFVLAFGIPTWVLMMYEILDAATVVFSHSRVVLPAWLERSLRYIVVTPGLHRLHHSVEPEEADTNFSAVFPVWDILFGTFCTKTPEPLALGVKDVRDDRSWSLLWLLRAPFGGARRRSEGPSATCSATGES